MIRKVTLPFLIFIALSFSSLAQQAEVTGILTDENKNPLPGVKVVLTGTSWSAVTAADGSFRMDSVLHGSYTLEKADSAFDYTPMPVVVADAVENLGSVYFEKKATQNPDDNIPTYSSSEEDMREASQGVASVLSASRDAFESATTYSFSVARFRVRGYSDENFVTLMNGAPMTDLTNDRTLYNTWSGLNDVTRNRESTHGLAPAIYSFGDIGGSYHIDSRASHQRRQLQVSYALSNRTYDNRFMVTYGSGVMKNGWAWSLSYSRRWSQAGYVDGTFYDGHSWFASVEKFINAKHSLSLTAFGAPTKYGRSAPAVQEMYDLADSHYYNPTWGYQNGEKRNSSVASHHRPVIILTHDWNISEKSNLVTAASYVSGKSNISGMDWYNATDPRPDYYRNLPSYILESTHDSALYNQAVQLYENDVNARQVKWDQMIINKKNAGDTSLYVVADRVIDSKIMSLNTTYNKNLNSHLELSAGLSFLHQSSAFYKELTDLLGGHYFVNLNQFADETIPDNIQNDLNNPNRKIYEGDRYHYDYNVYINKINGWGQTVFRYNKIDFFFALQLSQSSFYRYGNVRNGVFADNSSGASATQSFFNYSFKTGATCKLNGRNYIFANVSSESRAPLFDNVFIAPSSNNKVMDDVKSIKQFSAEGGYLLKDPRYKARAVFYFTESFDETDVKRYYNDDFRTFVNYAISGIDTRHVGAELSVEAILGKGFSASAVAAIGQNFYTSQQSATVTQDNFDSVLVTNETVYSRNLRVGGSPEKAYSLGLNYRSPQFWFVYLNANFFDGSYVQFNPVRRTAAAVDQLDENSELRAEILGQEKLDGQFTLDVSTGWSWKLNNQFKGLKYNTFLVFNIGINNILDNQDLIMTGYEQLRFDFINQSVSKFDTKYSYAYGTNFFASVTLRFN
jgi:Carboxypeptidase regulatory-like domain